jgi:hypothetical protein
MLNQISDAVYGRAAQYFNIIDIFRIFLAINIFLGNNFTE